MYKIKISTTSPDFIKSIPFTKINAFYIIPDYIDEVFENYLIKHPEKNTIAYRKAHYDIITDMLCHKNHFKKKHPTYTEHLNIHVNDFTATGYIIAERYITYDFYKDTENFILIYDDKNKDEYKIKSYDKFKSVCKYKFDDNLLYTLQHVKLDLASALIEVIKNKIDSHDLIPAIAKIIKFNNSRYITSGKKVTRIYSSFTDMPSCVRQYLTIDGKSFHSFDIVAAQPTLLIAILNKYNLPIDKEYIDSCHSLYETMMLAAKEVNFSGEYVPEIVDNVKTGRTIFHSFNNRDDIKVLLFRSIFFGQKYAGQSLTSALFKALFPSTFKSLFKLKKILKQDNVSLAQCAQNMEADLIFECMPKCNYYTVHDSIYVTDKEEGELFSKRITDKLKDVVEVKWHYKYYEHINHTNENNDYQVITIDAPDIKVHKTHKASDKSLLKKEFFKEYYNSGLTRDEIIAKLDISVSTFYSLKKLLINDNSANKPDIYIKENQMIVLFNDEYELLKSEIDSHDFIMIPTYHSNKLHPKHFAISALYFYFIQSNLEFILPINHYDKILPVTSKEIIDLIYKSDRVKYILNKKTLLYNFPQIKNVIDVELCNYLYKLNLQLSSEYKRTRLTNPIYPVIKHLENCQLIKSNIINHISVFDKIKNTKPYKFYSDIALPAFHIIEANGLNVNKELFTELNPDKKYHLNEKNDLIYSMYNFYTTTGRPSNTFSNLNFAALNKSDQTREMFTSRYKGGKLIEFDYSAFHPHLILNLLDYKIDEDNIYTHLTKYFYDNPTYSAEEHDEVKKITFQLLYGDISKEFEIIPFFQKTSIFISDTWDTYKKNNFIKSPVSERLLHKKFFKQDTDFGKYKLWNYLIQLLETEHNILVIKDIIQLLKTKKFHSKLILYTYDSFLFDFNPLDNEEELINQLKNTITQNKKYPVSIKSGSNYKNMNKIINNISI